MTATSVRSPGDIAGRFGHEAMFYRGMDGFLDGLVPFIQEGLDGDEAILVAVDPAKIELLQDRLGHDARRVTFVDMPAMGRNPARIIPVWQEFVDRQEAANGPFRGVGEPIWPGRSDAEMIECHLHESLLNVAFDDGPAWRLVCPYDEVSLGSEVIAEAQRTHPLVMSAGVRQASDRYAATRAVTEVFDSPFPEPPFPVTAVPFDISSLSAVRDLAARQAAQAGLPQAKVSDLVLAVNEIATNSLRHGGGSGTLRLWKEHQALICEVRDEGYIDQPMVGRVMPKPDQMGGRGLWMVNQLCDLLQLRSSPTGAAVRIHISLP